MATGKLGGGWVATAGPVLLILAPVPLVMLGVISPVVWSLSAGLGVVIGISAVLWHGLTREREPLHHPDNQDG